MGILDILLALLALLASFGGSSDTDTHSAPLEPRGPIVSVLYEDGSYIMDGEVYCLPNEGCADGGTPTTPHEWAAAEMDRRWPILEFSNGEVGITAEPIILDPEPTNEGN